MVPEEFFSVSIFSHYYSDSVMEILFVMRDKGNYEGSRDKNTP